MANEDRPHFRISRKDVRTEKIAPSGFGSTFKRENYGDHGRTLKRRVSEVKQDILRTKDSNLVDSLFLEVKTPESVPIRQESQKLSQVGMELVAYSKRAENIGTVKVTRKEFDKLQNRIDRYANRPNHPGKSFLSILEDIAPVPVEEKISPNLPKVSRDTKIESIVFFYEGLSSREKDGIIGQMDLYLNERNAEFKDIHTFSTGDTTAVVIAYWDTLLELGRDFSTLRQIGPDRAFFVTDSTPVAALPNPVEVNSPSNPIIVAVVDSGIRPTTQLILPAISGSMAFLPPNSVDAHYEHGTFVASRILFGDDLEGKLQNQPVTPICHVLDVRVMGKDAGGSLLGLDEQGLAKAIDSAVQAFSPLVRVVNISLGNNEAIQDDEYSLVANIIDHNAREHNLLFVTTAGNIRDPRLVATFPAQVTYPGWRIDLPGESILALTVGSVARFIDANSISRVNELSPFSRVGPGSDRGIKPEVVAHGGNCNRNGLPTSRIAVLGVHGDGTQIAFDVGTSFAAPLVSGIAAVLFDYYSAASANLIKALICHFTNDAIPPNGIPDSIMSVGFGIPDLTRATSSGTSNAAFLYEGTIRKNVYQYIPFYVPNAMASGSNGAKLKIKGTICYDPPVQPSNPKEYSCARISCSLIKRCSGDVREVQLSDAFIWNQPWNPISKFEKMFTRAFDPGNWEIRVRLWTRGRSDDFVQRFSIIIEVIDESNGIDVWSEIANEAGSIYIRDRRQVA